MEVELNKKLDKVIILLEELVKDQKSMINLFSKYDAEYLTEVSGEEAGRFG